MNNEIKKKKLSTYNNRTTSHINIAPKTKTTAFSNKFKNLNGKNQEVRIKEKFFKIKGKNGRILGLLYGKLGIIGLFHWKEGENYLTQLQIKTQGKDWEPISETYTSTKPIYEDDFELENYIKNNVVDLGFENEHADELIFVVKKVSTEFKLDIFDILSPKKDTTKFKLEYPTAHLKGFDDLHVSTRLIGDEYIPIIKAVYYSLVSVILSKVELRLGGIRADGRISLLIVMKSGSGKGEIKRVIKAVLKQIDKTCVEPTSYHPEQFIGKTRIIKAKGGTEEYKQIPGHLSHDYILIDEGKNLLSSKDPMYSESRRYLRQALDISPNNEITKKSVDIPSENALSFVTNCCVCIFVQPYSFNEEFALDGDLRRIIVPYVNIAPKDPLQGLKDRILDDTDDEQAINDFGEFIKSLGDVKGKFKFTDDAKETFAELSVLLIRRGYSVSPKIKNYVDMAKFSIQNTFLRFAAIQALINKTTQIESKHVELAFVDLIEFMELNYDFIEKKIKGELDYGEKWHGATSKDQEALKWLHDQGATSLESSVVTMKDYKDKIGEIYNLKEKAARNRMHQHEKEGWIKTKKGQHNSQVWLSFDPEKDTSSMASMARVASEIQKKYSEIIEKHGLT